jgi:hypothetical protein
MESVKEAPEISERASPVESIDAPGNSAEDVDFIEEDLQSRVSKPLVRWYLA